jgi:DNA-binding transcriptional MerR regulator
MSIDDVRSYRDQRLLQAPRRKRSRTDDFAFQAEHLERLRLIKHALEHGLTIGDIAQLVDSSTLMTCGDVYAVTARRLEQVRRSDGADSPRAAALEKLLDLCARVGPRSDCGILAALANPDMLSGAGCCGAPRPPAPDAHRR